jgi:diketogulonate reductase-like aldo/keto reductase
MAAAPRAAPHVGFGLYKVAPPDCYAIALAALRAGYRHLDTAQFYGNETETGAAVRDFLAEHPGERVHVTTKVWPLTASLPPGQALARVRASIAQSQAALGVPIDTLLLHAPGAGGLTRDETWRAMEEAVARGAVKELGVSNFGQAHLEHLLARCAVTPRVNQIVSWGSELVLG